MNWLRQTAVLALSAGVMLAGFGCDRSRDEMRPDLDSVRDEPGLQSRDLREMASRLAPDMLQCNDIRANPYKIVVVVKHLENKTEDMHGRDLDIYLAALASNLNTVAASDRVAFVEERATLAKLQSEELGGGGGAPSFEDESRNGAPPPRSAQVTAQYALYGTLFSMANTKTNFYLFQFKLTNLTTGVEAWHGQYQVRTLN
jgi:hypothetical protein